VGDTLDPEMLKRPSEIIKKQTFAISPNQGTPEPAGDALSARNRTGGNQERC
jgi:hypothetical protein